MDTPENTPPADGLRIREADALKAARQLSPLRNSTAQTSVSALAAEQLAHFHIDAESEYGKALSRLVESLYESNLATHDLWRITFDSLADLERGDRTAWFNAKRFVCFQLAKILDNLQNPLRRTYQSLIESVEGGFVAKGAYPIFDNVSAIFSATPVVARTATYLYACAEWAEDAFKGREALHAIYSRLINPTAIALANHIVDLEAGANAPHYLAWNFNSGMAAIDATLSHLVGREDIIVVSRNVYGGTYQLLEDWFQPAHNLDVAIEWMDGTEAHDFTALYDTLAEKYRDRLQAGRKVYLYLESPSNPHGYVLDVPAIARAAHERGVIVICDSTIGTPFLHCLLRRADAQERPDFVIHSYTKDIAGSGTTTAGVVIGPTPYMFVPKDTEDTWTFPDGSRRTVPWKQSMFWNVFYVKGSFLDADKAFEVLSGSQTLNVRMLPKCINTLTLVRALERHPAINVRSPAAKGNPNAAVAARCMHLGLPAPLLTIDFEPTDGGARLVSDAAFRRFFDLLEPGAGLQVSLGQMNTVILCPALTSHSELSAEALAKADISRTSIRISVGAEDPRLFLVQVKHAAEAAFAEECPNFVEGFASTEVVDQIYRDTYLEVHTAVAAAFRPGGEIER